MAFGDSDIAAMLSTAVFGVPVVFSGVTVPGILDIYDTRDPHTQSIVDIVEKYRVVTIQTGSISPINESSLTVDGVSFKVRDIIQSADGSLTHLYVVTP